MMQLPELEKINVAGFEFLARVGTSDPGALRDAALHRPYDPPKGTWSGDTWLDLGANAGGYTILQASMGHDVIAVEPEPETCELLRANVQLNGLENRVTVVEAAVADVAGSATMFRGAKGSWASSSLLNRWKKAHEREQVTVKVITLEDVLDLLVLEDRGNVAVKLDIEGAELGIIDALTPDVAARIGYAAFEYHFPFDARIDHYHARCAKLQELGFEVKKPKVPSDVELFPMQKFSGRIVKCWRPQGV